MSTISSTISQVAATNPAVASAVNDQQTKGAILANLQSGGDTPEAGLLGALANQKGVATQLLDSVQHPFLGQNIDIRA